MIDQTPVVRTARSSSRLRPLLLTLVFLAGLLLGWLVIGWMLWPVQWIDATPANLRMDDQRQFVNLAAGEYAQTGNAALAQERLASWDEESLATLLALMEQQAMDEAARSALAGLREALLIPQTTLSFWDTILNQKLIVISAVLGGLMLLTAVALTLYPAIHQARVRRARQKQMETEEEALLMANTDTSTTGAASALSAGVSTSPAPTQEQTAAETAAPSPAAAQPEPQTPNSQPVQPQPVNPPPVAAPADEAQNAANQPQPAPTDSAAKTNEAPAAAPPAAQPPAPANPPQPVPAPPVKEDEEEEQDSIQSILTSVFEDDEDSTHYESLLKGLADIDALKLVSLVEQTAKQLRARQPKGKTAVSPTARTMT